MNVYERDDRNITRGEIASIASRLSQSAKESILNSVPRSITYSAHRNKMYLACEKRLEWKSQQRVKGELEDAAKEVFGRRTRVRVRENVNEFAVWCFECKSESGIEWHHIVPKTSGGTQTVPLCDHCHSIITSEQDLSAIGKELFRHIDARVKGDSKFLDKVAQRHGGRFIADDRLAEISTVLIKLYLVLAEKNKLELFVDHRSDSQLLERRARSLVRSLPLPTDRRYSIEDVRQKTA